MSTSNGNDRFDRESRSSREQEDNRDVILTVRVLMHGKVNAYLCELRLIIDTRDSLGRF